MNLRDAAYHLVHDYAGGANSPAPRLDMNSTYLSAQVSCTGTAKLGLLDASKLTHLTGDHRILHAFAAEHNCTVRRLPDVDDAVSAYQELAETAGGFGSFFASAVDAMKDSKVTANELAQVDRELASMIAVALRLRRALAAVHEAGKPSHLKAAA